MRALTRVLAAAGAAALTVPVWTVPAAAETTSSTETAAYGAYFSSTGIRKPDASPAAPPNVTNNADGVESGKLAVAARAGMDDKISFLYFQLADLPAGATITKATVTVPLASGGQNVAYGAGPAKVLACPAGPEGFFGEDGAAMEDAPSRSCDKASAVAELSTDATAYVFDATAIAALWVTANDGLALVPNEGARTTPFQVVFESADRAELALEYTAPAEPTTSGTGSDTTDTSLTGTGTGTGTASDPGTVSFDPGLTSGSGISTTDLGSVGSTSTAPLVGGVPPATTPEPLTAGPGTVTTQRAAADLPVEVLAPTPAFWLGALLLAGALLLLALVLGDSRSPALALTSRPSRLSRALVERQRGEGRTALLQSTS